MKWISSLPFRARRKRILVIALVAALLIFHRTPNRPFHPVREDCQSLESCGTIEREPATIAFVEFDDQGDYFDQRQSLLAFALIRETLKQRSSGADLFVFVHGWQHNAASDDLHVQQFRAFLAKRATQTPTRKTIGVFIGWPGETLRFPLNGLTFWSRKAAAHRVASGAVQEFFATLQQVKRDQELAAENTPLETIVPNIYVIGHSFGGLIAFQANSQSFALRYGGDVLMNRGGPMVTGIGDLVILINPAIEAMRFSSLGALSTEYPNDPFYSPVLVTVASETDWATRFLFPLGVLGGTIVTNQVRSGQWTNTLTTAGNAETLVTHRAFVDRTGGVTVCERPHTLPQRKVPFWFISAASSLVDGHGDLNGDKLFSLFVAIQRHREEKVVGGLPSCERLNQQVQ